MAAHRQWLLSALLFALSMQLTPAQFCSERFEADRLTYAWSMTVGETTHFDSTLDRYSYDPNLKTVALRRHWSDAKKTFTDWLIYDYPNKKLYTVRNGTCESSPLNGSFDDECVPDRAQILYTSTFLGFSLDGEERPGDGVFINEVNFTTPGGAAFQITAPPYPVTRRVYSSAPGGGLLLQEMFFMNPDGVEDSHVFLPPDYCK